MNPHDTGDTRDAIEDRAARLFWAVPVGGAVAALARETRDALMPQLASPRIHWHPDANWHLTLCFLGNTTLARGLATADALRAPVTALAAFDVTATAAEWFPSHHQPLAIALPVASTPPLLALAGACVQAATDAGLAPEARPYRGHVSLARVKHGFHPQGALPQRESPKGIVSAGLAVREAVLFESVGTVGGVRYRPVLSLPLREAGSS